MVVRYVSHRSAFFIEAVLAFLLIVALVFAVTGFVKAQNAQVSINEAEAARIADKRSKIYADYAACTAGIPNLRRINRFLHELRDDYNDRADQSLALANLPSTPEEERVLRLEAAQLYRAKAQHVPIFPGRTRKECAAERARAFRELQGLSSAPRLVRPARDTGGAS